ncbi:MAG: hypothetical protein KKD33_02720 [Verrucomicrobia bacterium]|nr:hypothetical protein [Verrucomicrobiota bacterium]MBU4285926.1 hypothetical protein [Verrucomicrobiota bacterium]
MTPREIIKRCIHFQDPPRVGMYFSRFATDELYAQHELTLASCRDKIRQAKKWASGLATLQTRLAKLNVYLASLVLHAKTTLWRSRANALMKENKIRNANEYYQRSTPCCPF